MKKEDRIAILVVIGIIAFVSVISLFPDQKQVDNWIVGGGACLLGIWIIGACDGKPT